MFEILLAYRSCSAQGRVHVIDLDWGNMEKSAKLIA
jgi:hypothetical protein